MQNNKRRKEHSFREGLENGESGIIKRSEFKKVVEDVQSETEGEVRELFPSEHPPKERKYVEGKEAIGIISRWLKRKK